MPKKKSSKKGAAVNVPKEPMIMALGLAAIMREKTYDVLEQALEQTKWIGKSQKELQNTLLSRGEKEYARLVKDVERSLDTAMKQMKKPIKKKPAAKKNAKRSIGKKK